MYSVTAFDPGYLPFCVGLFQSLKEAQLAVNETYADYATIWRNIPRGQDEIIWEGRCGHCPNTGNSPR